MKEIAILLTVLLIGGVALAYEEPAYEIIDQREDYEVRRYSPYIVAETVVHADFDDAGNQAFRRLYAYISGNNRSAETMETTRSVAPSPRNEKIEMTIPVVATTPARAVDGPASYTYYFVMPSEYALDSLPRPDDPRITIRQMPERTVAVRRYSGRSNESNYRKNRDLLLQALQRDSVTLAGEPARAVYNGPFTPWFMRRNEVMVDIRR
jgi:hypothetical protein